MSAAALERKYSFRDYVLLERDSNVKHEYLDGTIYAMAGGSPEHALRAANVIGLLRPQLRGGPCRVYSSDLRVRALGSGLATYPGGSVVCGPLQRDPDDRHTVLNPTVLVEVLSPTTAAYDRTAKVEDYKSIPSLGEVLLVAHDEVLCELWRRNQDGTWSRTEARGGETVELSSLGCTLAVDEVYEGTLEAIAG